MSRIFSITPAPGHRLLTMERVMNLGPAGLRPYDIDGDDIDAFLATTPDEVVSLWGIDPYSSRGFELDFSAGGYNVRVCTPASPNDWRIALDVLAALSRYLGEPIRDEDGSSYSPETITSFPFARDIGACLTSLRTAVERGSTIQLGGVRRSVSFTTDMLRRVLDAQSPEDEFGETMRVIQQLDAYDANQMVARAPKGEVLGMYTLTESVATILPLEPRLSASMRRQIGTEVPVEWTLTLIGIEGPADRAESYVRAGEVRYREALARLPQHKIRVLDGASMLVDGLDRAELAALRR